MYYGRWCGLVSSVLLLIGVTWAGPADAQEPRGDRRAPPRAAEPKPERAKEQAEPGPYPVPPQIYEDFAFPDPDRPWGRGRYLDPYRHYDRGWGARSIYPRGGYREGRGRDYHRYYYDDYTYRFGVPHYDDPYASDVERAYRQGVADGQDYERFEVQAERGLMTYQRAMLDGHAAFGVGEYGAAARHFLLAATLNQGDPASRICAAHAEFALGQYEPAVKLLRRAFELQPKLAYLPLDIRSAYGVPADFVKHLRVLRVAVKDHKDNADLWFLLGYCFFYTNEMGQAADALANASRLSPNDRLYARLAELSATTAPPRKTAPAGKKPQP